MAQAAKHEKQIAGGDAPQRVIALSLAHLIQPHKKHEPLSLRIERLPQGARLNKGSRNNNGSWSLTPGDLDDLKYMPPAGAPAEHALALRIISLVGGDTLAVTEVPVSGGAAETSAAPDAAAPAVAIDNGQLRVIAGELASVKAVLAASEAASEELRRQVEAATALSKQNAEAALAAARAASQAELDMRLAEAAAHAATALNEQRKTWQSEQAAALAAAAEQAKKDLAAAREGWQRETREALAKADAAWAEKSAKAAAEARATANAAQSQSHEGELGRLRETLKTVEAKLAERERAFAEAAKASEEASARERRDAQEALAKAERTWKDAEAARFAAAEAEWHAKIAKASTPAPTEAGKDKTLDGLRDEMNALKATIEERDRALAEAQKALGDARGAAQHEMQAALAKANEAWSAAEAARFAAFETEWQEKLAKASANAPAAPDPAPAPAPAPAPTPAPAPPPTAADPAQEGEVRRLREQVATLQGILEDREEKSSRDGEAERLAAELAKARAKAKDEIAALKATLAQREAELSRAKAAAATAATPHALADFEAAARPSFRVRELVNRADDAGAQDKRRLTRDLIFAAVVGGVLVFFYPDIEALIVGERPIPVRTIPMPRPKPELPAPPVVVPDRTAVAARNAKLRGEPSTSAPVAGSLTKGANVVVVEERDGWFLVRVDAEPGKREQARGWVKGTLLKDIAPPPAP